jgi:Ca2+:H+ antiporter
VIFTYLLLLVPVSLALAYVFHAPPLWVFISSILAIVPLAEWMRRAIDQLARMAGPAIGGLLSVTFGNAAELILALFVLRQGDTNVVKGQITGSIIGNGLLGLGLAVVVGSWGRGKQTFDRARVGLLSSLLLLALIALLVPALFDYTERGLYKSPDPRHLDENLSLGVSVVLILVYAANLVYTLVTHRDVFGGEKPEGGATWSKWAVLGVLAGATALIAVEADLVSEALGEAAGRLGLSTFFLGVILLAVVGNASEYAAAVYFARRDQMDLVLGITVGSSIQVALLVAPLLVLVSYFLGNPMDLVFENPIELVSILAVAFTVRSIAQDGESTWFEGVLLLAVYFILALAFFFVTP